MAIINYIPNVKTATGFDTLNTVSQFTNHVATGVFTNGDTYEINVPAPNDILTGQFVLIFVPDTDSIVGMKISINNGVAIPIDGVGVGSLQNGVATSLLVNTVIGKAYMQVLGVKTPNKNLLHNWDFRNPVNQRGQSSYTNVFHHKYTVDRWFGDTAWGAVASNVTLNAGTGITVTSVPIPAYPMAYGQLKQAIENASLLNNQTITLSAEVTAVGPSSDGTYPTVFINNASVSVTTAGIVSVTTTLETVSDIFVGVSVYAGSSTSSSISIKRMKLELGSVSTLANDPPADFGEQLALCQRYFKNISGYMIRMSYYQPNYIAFPMFVISEGMRLTTPTITSTGFEVYSPQGSPVTGFTLGSHSVRDLIINKTAHGLTDATLYFINGFASADL